MTSSCLSMAPASRSLMWRSHQRQWSACTSRYDPATHKDGRCRRASYPGRKGGREGRREGRCMGQHWVCCYSSYRCEGPVVWVHVMAPSHWLHTTCLAGGVSNNKTCASRSARAAAPIGRNRGQQRQQQQQHAGWQLGKQSRHEPQAATATMLAALEKRVTSSCNRCSLSYP